MEQKSAKKFLQDLIIVNSPRIGFHQITPVSFKPIKPQIHENFDYLSLDGSLNRAFLVCKHCRYLQSNQCSNRKYLFHHLELHHNIKDTCEWKAKVPKPRVCPLKAKKTPLFPLYKNRPKLEIAAPIGSAPPKPTSGTVECSKQESGKHEVLQSTLQAALKSQVPLYRTEELVVELAKLEDDPKNKIEKKKRERKRKMEKDLPNISDEEEIHDD